MAKGDYALGFHGHARICDCVRCANVKKRRFNERLAEVYRLRESGLVRQPSSTDQTVFVRAHFKRAPGHLKKFPRTRMAYVALLKRYTS